MRAVAFFVSLFLAGTSVAYLGCSFIAMFKGGTHHPYVLQYALQGLAAAVAGRILLWVE